MNVIYYDPFRQEAFEQEIGAKYCTFDEVIETADVVSCHMPYTKENHHIINKDVFARMKKTAYFVNVARGPIMNEKDLIDACRNHVIRGAATDVYENEPVTSMRLAAAWPRRLWTALWLCSRARSRTTLSTPRCLVNRKENTPWPNYPMLICWS